MFVQGGVYTDQIVKFDGHGVGAAAFSAGDGYFSAGNANGLVRGRTIDGLVSGGHIFFGGRRRWLIILPVHFTAPSEAVFLVCLLASDTFDGLKTFDR